MSMEDKPVLELPLGSVSQCVLPGTSTTKTEVELQFIETDAADRDEDALVEVRAPRLKASCPLLSFVSLRPSLSPCCA